MTDLTGKVVLITGAAHGIGRASVDAFARVGARVVATDVSVDLLESLHDLPNVSTKALDVLSNHEVARVVAQIGRIDVLFNCVGVVHSGTVLELEEKDLDYAFDLNFRSQLRTIRAVLPQMLERRDGAILNMATVASSVKGVPNRAAYSMSKAAVVGLTKSVAADFIKQNIRVNAICPGTVESPSLHDRWKATGNFESARRAFMACQPIGRIAQPSEIADLAVYLAGATYTTGQIHVIDGGWTA